MEKNTTSGSFTRANLIAVIGLALFGVLTYMGQMCLTGGELSTSVLYAVILVAIAAFLLWGMIYAKSVDNDFKKWCIVEWGILVVYVLFAIFSSESMFHYFMVNDQKENLKITAFNDIDNIEKLYDEYEAFENSAIGVTYNSLLITKGSRLSSEVSKFLQDNGVEPNDKSIESYIEKLKVKLVGDDYKRVCDKNKRDLEAHRAIIKDWSVLNVPNVAKEIEDKAQKIADDLTKRSKSGNKHSFDRDSYTSFVSFSSKNIEKEYKAPETDFRNQLKNTDRSLSVVAILLFFAVHCLILLNYVVSYRSAVVEIGNKRSRNNGIDDGGINLYD